MTEQDKMDILGQFTTAADAQMLIARLLQISEEGTVSEETADRLWSHLEDFRVA